MKVYTAHSLTPRRPAMTLNAQAIAATLRANLGLKCSRSRTRFGAWKHLAVLPSWLPQPVVTAMYGIDWAMSTGRLAGTIVMEIRAMTDWQLTGLVAEVADACAVSGEVPRFLIHRFTSQTAR